MAKRYVAHSPFSLGRGRRFNPDHRQPDGSFGYTDQQVDGLSKQQIRDHFDVVDVSGGQVEQATSAPGEKRSVSRVCDDCGFEAKSMAGLSVHRRSHE